MSGSVPEGLIILEDLFQGNQFLTATQIATTVQGSTTTVADQFSCLPQGPVDALIAETPKRED